MTSPLPEKYLRLMSEKDRQSVGQRTAAEVMANGVAISEKALQRQIVGLLRLKGIEPCTPAMHKRTTIAVGWPDITFCVQGIVLAFEHVPMPYTWPCLWEIKMPQGTLSQEQINMKTKLESNGWRHRVIRSVDEAIAELRSMGIE